MLSLVKELRRLHRNEAVWVKTEMSHLEKYHETEPLLTPLGVWLLAWMRIFSLVPLMMDPIVRQRNAASIRVMQRARLSHYLYGPAEPWKYGGTRYYFWTGVASALDWLTWKLDKLQAFADGRRFV